MTTKLNGNAKFAATILGIVLTIFAVAGAFFTVQSQANNNQKLIAELKKDKVNRDVVDVELKYIRQQLEVIMKKLDDIK